MNKENFKKALPLLVLVAVCGAFIFWQYSNLKQIEGDKIAYKKLEQEIALRKVAAERAELKDYLLGKFDPGRRDDFAAVPEKYNIAGYRTYLRRETRDAFVEMAEQAAKDGIELNIASADRNFEYQKAIWNNKWTGVTFVDGENLSKSIPDSRERFEKILEYSAVPGTSRHHWGTDIDINDANPSYFKTQEGMRIYDWLVENGSSFGFCQPYNPKDAFRSTGYNEEKWHWSYLPLAKNFTRDYGALITEEDIQGFLGDENVAEHNLITDYVLGINPECL